MTPLKLSVIIVNWNTRELLRACLTSGLGAGTDSVEVIVVDNGSTDGSATMMEHDFPTSRLIRNTANLGFVAANNQGIAASAGRYVLLLNSDTVVPVDAWASLVAAAEARPRAGIIGPTLVNPDGSIQWSVRGFPTLLDHIILFTKWHNFFPILLHRHLAVGFDYSREQVVDQVMGAAMLIRREVIDQIGGLDAAIWSWYEDVDYCARAKVAGWEVRYVPCTKIIHLKGQSFAQHLPLVKQRMLVQSILIYTKKHQGPLAWLILWPFGMVSIALAFGVQLFGIKKINREL
ncbi:MAG: glycosyltransferase family 2 protein [Patescibacteria group bacterium]